MTIMRNICLGAGLAALSLALYGCGNSSYNRPSLDPSRMSSDTLCYRSAGAKKNPDIENEIRARRLDCRAVLENDPLIQR
jgi:hypothetical protein